MMRCFNWLFRASPRLCNAKLPLPPLAQRGSQLPSWSCSPLRRRESRKSICHGARQVSSTYGGSVVYKRGNGRPFDRRARARRLKLGRESAECPPRQSGSRTGPCVTAETSFAGRRKKSKKSASHETDARTRDVAAGGGPWRALVQGYIFLATV